MVDKYNHRKYNAQNSPINANVHILKIKAANIKPTNVPAAMKT